MYEVNNINDIPMFKLTRKPSNDYHNMYISSKLKYNKTGLLKPLWCINIINKNFEKKKFSIHYLS